MSDTTVTQPSELTAQAVVAAVAASQQQQQQQQQCDECVGSGGWFRYEPALEPSPGLRYLSCLQCRGSGRLALARA
ncbi:hypothetical protein [Ramlibacter sp.]|uniref:hypothetical protein n=1 Tax=Ramlibacter sp. TaxID=1917967 RepID=UPI00260A9508|nr:hypothetical protein [Ramlibacter sp.]MDB5957186.1 hypothetical protein [Ramlibacter sp.]